MICFCDGCGDLFNHELKVVNAKEIYPNFCNIPLSKSFSCDNGHCKYNVNGGEACIEFMFCESCLEDKDIQENTFESSAMLWE